ncbi:MAG: phosphatidylserine decarboxylase family protein [Acidobacteria bacterium]|nr:phosphatidylserine decarboxylase family protein [Acidobacteriota bacterium]
MIARDGYPYLALGGGAIAASWLLGWFWPAIGCVFLTLFVGYFFRDPEREIPGDPAAIVSPADGRVLRVEPLDSTIPGSPQVISIFLSVFDVHVNRSPIAGRIKAFSHHPGRFLAAWKHEASTVNEQTHVTVQGERSEVVFKQIAGLIARRIVFTKSVGDQVGKGERVGMIKFGSKTDLLLPPGASPTVQPGDRVYGGASVVARWV